MVRTEIDLDGKNPWTSQPGFETCSLICDTETELENHIKEKYINWKVWIKGHFLDHPAVYLYRERTEEKKLVDNK